MLGKGALLDRVASKDLAEKVRFEQKLAKPFINQASAIQQKYNSSHT